MIGLEIGILVTLAVASMSLACVEAAFYLTKRRRFAHLALQNPRAELVNAYLEDPPALLLPIHIGTYTAHVAMTVIITALFLDWVAHWSMLVAFFFMVIYLLLFRLTLPYTLVRGNPERSLLLLLPAFDLYARAMSPLVSALRRRAAFEPPTEVPNRAPVPEVPPPPVHDEDEERLLQAVARFTETQVREVMTPRPDVVAVSADATVTDLRRLMRETKYSRLPVYGDNLDDIVGVISVRDVIEYDGDPSGPVRPIARPAFLVPETKKISALLKELQARRLTYAIVIDEYGGTAGIATIEDIVEELVGEIKDEYDVEAEPITVEPDGGVVVAGRVGVDRLEQALETRLADGEGVGTVGGLVTTLFGRIPRAGEKVGYRGFEVEVLDAERMRVNRVRFRRQALETETAS
jgi:CBS domain containing-hemolysin-like protein